MAVETAVLESPDGLIAVGAGIAIGLGALAAAWSQSALGSTALGIAAERPEFEKNVLIYMVIPELLALFGFAIAFLLLSKMGAGAPA
jgi:V/A-type H+-transporting ATPase subunit K